MPLNQPPSTGPDKKTDHKISNWLNQLSKHAQKRLTEGAPRGIKVSLIQYQHNLQMLQAIASEEAVGSDLEQEKNEQINCGDLVQIDLQKFKELANIPGATDVTPSYTGRIIMNWLLTQLSPEELPIVEVYKIQLTLEEADVPDIKYIPEDTDDEEEDETDDEKEDKLKNIREMGSTGQPKNYYTATCLLQNPEDPNEFKIDNVDIIVDFELSSPSNFEVVYTFEQAIAQYNQKIQET